MKIKEHRVIPKRGEEKSKWLMTSYSVQSKWRDRKMNETTTTRKKNYKSHSVVFNQNDGMTESNNSTVGIVLLNP